MENKILTPREFINNYLDENFQEEHDENGCTFMFNTVWELMEEYYKYRTSAETSNDASALPIPDVSIRSEQYVCECKVCGKPFGDKLTLYEHYDEEHNKQTY